MTWQRCAACGLTAVVIAAAVVGVLTSSSPAVIGSLVGGIAFAAIGSVIVFRYQGHVIGWLMVVLGVSWELSVVAPYYGEYADAHGLTGVSVAASVSIWVYMVNLLLFFWLAMVFPSGRIARGWIWIFWLGTAGIVMQGISQMIAPGPSNVAHVANPLGIAHFPTALDFLTSVLAIGALPAGALCALLRLRQTRGVERQQIKLFVYGVAIALLITTAAIFTGWNGPVGDLGSIALTLVPITIGAAILRYRLFDIDLIINRTLVYGSLTVTLGAFYVGGVIGLQALFRLVTGQSSDLAIAIATLAVAALFNPWRQRLQAFIDRRFYRRKYDAARTLTLLSNSLRDQVDLDQLSGDLTSVIQDTMQPAGLALWLRYGKGI